MLPNSCSLDFYFILLWLGGGGREEGERNGGERGQE